jgi:intracellular septation protein A
LLDLPILIIFFGAYEDGKMEIDDGVQRINTLIAFVANKIQLKGLEKLTLLNGFNFFRLKFV